MSPMQQLTGAPAEIRVTVPTDTAPNDQPGQPDHRATVAEPSAAGRGNSRHGRGRPPRLLMLKRKLLIGLTTAGLFVAGFSAGVVPASADTRTLLVTLLGGEQITVNVDV